MRPWATAIKVHGITVVTPSLPKGKAENAMHVFETALDEDPNAAIGGHSFGGRVASLVAAEREVSALVLLSYPLHRPGHPEEVRTKHWHKIDCPVLMLSGDRDQFATIDLLRKEVKKLKDVELHIYPGLGHGVQSEIQDAAERIVKFLKSHK